MMASYTRCLLAMMALIGAVGKLHADFSVLDWAATDWPAGTRTNTISNVGGSAVDIRITVSGSTTGFIAGYPEDDMSGEGTAPDDRDALWLRMDQPNTNVSVNVLVEFFNTGTTIPVDVLVNSIPIYDIDSNNTIGNRYRDQLRNWTGSNAANLNFRPSASFVSLPGDASFTIDSQASTTNLTAILNNDTPQSPDPASNQGSAVLSFDTNAVARFSYEYGNAGGLGSSNPTLQFTGLGNIIFSVIPEPSSFVLAALGWGLLTSRRRHARRL